MRRKTITGVISIGCILAIIGLVVLISQNRSYPSVFGNAIKKASGVEFSVQFQSVDHVQQLVCTIRNQSDDELTYGQAYYLEKEEGGEWFEVADITGKRADERNWDALAYTVPAKSEKEILVSMSSYRSLPKGNYRMIKKISRGQNGSLTDKIVACFKIE